MLQVPVISKYPSCIVGQTSAEATVTLTARSITSANIGKAAKNKK
jgi:hypothetical protein